MPKLTLIYFVNQGRAEASRLMLHYRKVDFEDKRVEGEEWQELKPTLPAGQIPVLVIDGETICQSGAIHRYIGRNYGSMFPKHREKLYASLDLDGNTLLEKAHVDMCNGCADDFHTSVMHKVWMHMFVTPDEAKWKAALAETKATKMPEWLGNMRKLLGDRNFFLGDKVKGMCGAQRYILFQPTYADFNVAVISNIIAEKLDSADVLAKFPALVAHKDRIHSLPGVKEYVAQRPKTFM